MSESDLSGLFDAERREEVLGLVEKKFASSDEGKSLKKLLRWDRYRPKNTSAREWVRLFGEDAQSLTHMRLSRIRTQNFAHTLLAEELISQEDIGFLLLSASIHDWGKLHSGQSINWEHKTTKDIEEEQHSFIKLFDKFIGKEHVKIKYIAEQTIFNSGSRLGEVFSVIERLGYLETALAAYKISKSSDDTELANHLRWLCAGVFSNQMVRLMEFARLYSPVKSYLDEHNKGISEAFEKITSHIFIKHGQNERVRHDLYLQAKTAWEAQDADAAGGDSRKKSFNKGIFGHETNFHKRFVDDYEEIARIADSCRALGLEVVLASGSYDMLHIGHVKYLEKAHSYGDILIVGLDSDAKIRKRKGPHRPIVPERERLEILSHIRHVDVITLKPPSKERWQLIKTVRPDTLIATAETYTSEEIQELEDEYCGKVVILEPQATTSTSAKIRRLQIGWEKRILHPIQEVMNSRMEDTEKMENISKIITEAQGDA